MLTGILVLAAGMAALALVAIQRARIKIPVARIADAAENTLVRIHGRVSADAPLRAPYTGRPCVYYKLELAYAQFNRRVRHTHTNSCDFTVTDDTGVARVFHERAQFEAAPDEGEVTRASRLSAKAHELLRELKWSVPDIASVELAESVIAIGDEVSIAGTPAREVDLEARGERGFRDTPGTQLVFSGNLYALKHTPSLRA